jgi:ribosomal protein S27AE
MATQAPDDSQIPAGEHDSQPNPPAELTQPAAPTCPNCGGNIDSGNKFCPNCGARIGGGDEPESDTDIAKDVVGDIKSWTTIDIALDGWEYRVWQEWIKNDIKTAKLLLDILQQFDPQATMSPERSESKPDSPDAVFAYRFSLYGDPDGIMEAATTILETFIGATENYKVKAGTSKAYISYNDGTTDEYRDKPSEGTDVDEALRLILDKANHAVGGKQWTKEKGRMMEEEEGKCRCGHGEKWHIDDKCRFVTSYMPAWACPCEHYEPETLTVEAMVCPNCERAALTASFKDFVMCRRCGYQDTEANIKAMWAVRKELISPWPTKSL